MDKNPSMIDMVQIKQQYERFKQWKDQPYDYQCSSEQHHCNNCGNDFIGNFCPVCSQKAGMGRIGWHSVRQGVMDIWGLGTRSLIYSLWQLLWRPGHFIADYIDGKRQVSFPPVKMLFIIAVVYSMLAYWLFPVVLGINVVDADIEQAQVQAVRNVTSWMKANYSWFSLIMALLAVLPTWVMFRYSPRHTAHTLPEGFFIQVFLAVLMIVWSILLIPFGLVDSYIYSFIVYALYGLYYIIVYKHLFGYSLWGTLWRSGFILSTVFCAMLSGVYLLFDIDIQGLVQSNGMHPSAQQAARIKYYLSGVFLVLALMSFVGGIVINYIATRKQRRQLKQAAD